VTDAVESDSDESLAPAAEALVCRVVDSPESDIRELIRMFPHAAEFLRRTAPILPRESTVGLGHSGGVLPADDSDPSKPDEATSSHQAPPATGTLARGQAMEICRRFELDLKEGRAPLIEHAIGDVAEPRRSALLSTLLAAEMQFRLRSGNRPRMEGYLRRFPAHHEIVKAVFASAVGPERIGAFGVIRLLGGGSFGTVYLCRDVQLDRLVAIKVPRADRFAGPDDVERFLREARLAARIKHPGIVTVFQVDRDPAVGCFVVLEYVEGRSLSEHLTKKRLATSHTADLMIAIAEALSFAHEQGLVHRDLKPANILLDVQGRPHIADFGLAVHEDERWPARGEVAGTPPYMAPEQVRGESHRLDGRTDIWGLGVILYRMLTGQRPFDGKSTENVFDDILNREPVPPRQRDRKIPRELERICLKCLSKRMTDRYATASDLAEDLREWQTGAGGERHSDPKDRRDIPSSPAPNERHVDDSGAMSSVQVRPKGLRAFDVGDRDFFLGLLPGPRDREGLPESLKFWKTRIDAEDSEGCFSVGLLSGPSGGGKTSMIKAGLLCILSPVVIPVYVEASPDTTEARLKAALHRVAVGELGGLSLPEIIAGMRGRALLPEGRKVLIVLDQFEQWLHGDPAENKGQAELIGALRQCDGVNVQCLILVRDDFAMAAARFMRALEVRLIESQNFATVDLFDHVHARKVLRAFGVAYERFGPNERGYVGRFLDQAVSELAVEGKIAPVRLALFAQMIKDKPWTPATLRDVGGLAGIGVTFLEESLAGPSANPEHRLHLAAARAVLKALLPQGGADIRGHMISHEELLRASGYDRRPRDFETLLTILGNELRLITPTEPGGPERVDGEQAGAPGGRHYHLTHDYLVPSLRDWLTKQERETIGGRAAIRLAERTAEWTARPARRYLPSWWEWLMIIVFTQGSRRSAGERRLVRAASLHHATRVGLALAIVAAISALIYDRLGAARAASAVNGLLIAKARDLPKSLQDLMPYRHWADPLLKKIADDQFSDDHREFRARLGLLPVDVSQAGVLLGVLFEDDPDDFLTIRDALRDHGDRPSLEQKCREVLGNERETPARRLRAGLALAGLLGDGVASQDDVLRGTAGLLSDQLLADLLAHPDRYNDWLAALRPAGRVLVPSLERIFRDPQRTDGDRFLAATILAKSVAGDTRTLTELLLDADTRQFPVILRALSGFQSTVTPRLRRVIGERPHAIAAREARIAHVGRQANAAIGVWHCGDPGPVWDLLRGSTDPLLQTYLIDRLPRLAPDGSAFARRLAEESNVSARRALVLILGGIPTELRSPTWNGAAINLLMTLYENDHDAGVHSAAEWALGQCRQESKVAEVSPRLRGGVGDGERSWYVTRTGHAMAIVRGPLTFRMGAGEGEQAAESDERPLTRTIPRTFAIATKEVTSRQFQKFRTDFGRVPEESRPDPDCPANSIRWLDAVLYCRWLSEEEHVPEEQMCYPPRPRIKPGMKPYPNYLSRTGYRLPTEAEWEAACRASTLTSRFFGDDVKMLGHYAWFINNSEGLTHRVGLRMPNEFGLFDVLGNVREWCQGIYTAMPATGNDRDDTAVFDLESNRVARGGSYTDRAHVLRSANRYYIKPDRLNLSIGFRVARTMPENRDTGNAAAPK
jgi:serine/threonine protein kinase/formylglycine-generating enzyme required for sulfatase activity